MKGVELAVVAVIAVVLFAGYRGYKDGKIIETVHVHVTSKSAVQGPSSIIRVNDTYSQIIPGAIHYIVYTPDEAFEVSEALYGGIEIGDQTWKVSGVKRSWSRRWILELM